MSHIGCQRNDDEGFQHKNLVSKKETNNNFPYLTLTLTVSVVWFSYVIACESSRPSSLPARVAGSKEGRLFSQASYVMVSATISYLHPIQ